MEAKVDGYLENTKTYGKELTLLREIALETGLIEEFKWKQPSYTFNGSIVFILSEFKNYCAINFFKGSLLKDDENLLVKPGENTSGGRQMRFTSTKEILDKSTTIMAYLFEAIEVEKAGLKVSPKKLNDFNIPEEFQIIMDQNSKLTDAFQSLTPGRQKAYIMHFSEPKQSKTRTARVEKYIPRILNGKGFHDCVCGLSKRMPSCDGSHKQLEKK